MGIAGKIYKSRNDSLWLCEIPLLDIMVQAESKEEMPEVIKDAIELLINDSKFRLDVMMKGNRIIVCANDNKKLYALMLKRQRQKQGLTLSEVANSLNAKSVNEYAQYEQGKHLPSLETLAKFLEAIDPELHVSLIC